jgi:hypothetical protein
MATTTIPQQPDEQDEQDPLIRFIYALGLVLTTDCEVTFCDGAVAVRQAPEGGLLTDALLPTRVDHPNIAAGGALLSRWPNAYAQFTRLIDTVYPYTDPEQAPSLARTGCINRF